jgi:phosphoenolpyruvate carboxylase
MRCPHFVTLRRSNKQTIMLGFSDGTKDGGYLMANWVSIKPRRAHQFEQEI